MRIYFIFKNLKFVDFIDSAKCFVKIKKKYLRIIKNEKIRF